MALTVVKYKKEAQMQDTSAMAKNYISPVQVIFFYFYIQVKIYFTFL